MIREDLREVAAIEFELANDDRLISSSASCAIHRARFSSSAESSSSVSSVVIGCGSGRGPWVVDEDLLGIMVALANSRRPSLGVLGEIEARLDGVANSSQVAAGFGKLQEEVAKYAGSRLLVGEHVFEISMLGL